MPKALLIVATNPMVPLVAMLETVRQYALERIAENPEDEQTIRRRHGEYYLHVVERAGPEPSTDRSERGLEVLEREIRTSVFVAVGPEYIAGVGAADY